MKRKILKRIIPIILSLMLAFCTSVAFAIPSFGATAKSVGTQAALESAVAAGGSIKLSKSITLSQSIVIPSEVEVTIDLNGKTLDRNLNSCVDQGSTIIVEPNATLTVTDSTGTNGGVITGGAAWKGGGICNYGTLTIEGGAITGNKALHETQGGGGGIYSGSYKGSVATLTIKGGIINNNRSRIGGGIYNGPGSTLNILQGERLTKKGAKKVTVYDNVVITDNKVTSHASGVFVSGNINIQDAPEIYGNNTDDNLYLSTGKKINFTGELKSTNKIIVKGNGTNPVITSNYGKFNTKSPSDLFASATTDAVMMLNTNKEIYLKTDTDTVVQLFDNSGLRKTENYNSVETAWDKAVSYGNSWKRVEITLGGDWEHDRQLKTANGNTATNIVLDLNGHYIKRARNFNQKDDGEVFYIPASCTFTVKDSNPNCKGYDGLKGGVICGGASTNGAGGIHISEKGTLNMLGGTLYECITNSDGGGIEAYGSDITVNMKNCSVVACQTFDASTETNGGGIYIYNNTKLTLENVLFENCYSEDNGGAIYASLSSGATINMKNCTFAGNKAYNYGGAVYVTGNKQGSAFKADGCKFLNNISGDDGGAVAIDGATDKDKDGNRVKHSPLLFNNCVFKANKGAIGSAMDINYTKAVFLNDCTITDNIATDYAGIYVAECVNLSGITVIKDNKSQNSSADLYLSQGGEARSTGLMQGSYITVDRITSTGQISAKMSEYQMQYFHPVAGHLEFVGTETVETPFITASVFGNGSVYVIIAIGVAAILVIATALIVKKKKGGIQDDEDYEQD